MSDGLSVNGSELAKGLTYNLPEQVVITGGPEIATVSRTPG